MDPFSDSSSSNSTTTTNQQVGVQGSAGAGHTVATGAGSNSTINITDAGITHDALAAFVTLAAGQNRLSEDLGQQHVATLIAALNEAQAANTATVTGIRDTSTAAINAVRDTVAATAAQQATLTANTIAGYQQLSALSQPQTPAAQAEIQAQTQSKTILYAGLIAVAGLVTLAIMFKKGTA